jgi:hypothetical protein
MLVYLEIVSGYVLSESSKILPSFDMRVNLVCLDNEM